MSLPSGLPCLVLLLAGTFLLLPHPFLIRTLLPFLLFALFACPTLLLLCSASLFLSGTASILLCLALLIGAALLFLNLPGSLLRGTTSVLLCLALLVSPTLLLLSLPGSLLRGAAGVLLCLALLIPATLLLLSFTGLLLRGTTSILLCLALFIPATLLFLGLAHFFLRGTTSILLCLALFIPATLLFLGLAHFFLRGTTGVLLRLALSTSATLLLLSLPGFLLRGTAGILLRLALFISATLLLLGLADLFLRGATGVLLRILHPLLISAARIPLWPAPLFSGRAISLLSLNILRARLRRAVPRVSLTQLFLLLTKLFRLGLLRRPQPISSWIRGAGGSRGSSRFDHVGLTIPLGLDAVDPTRLRPRFRPFLPRIPSGWCARLGRFPAIQPLIDLPVPALHRGEPVLPEFLLAHLIEFACPLLLGLFPLTTAVLEALSPFAIHAAHGPFHADILQPAGNVRRPDGRIPPRVQRGREDADRPPLLVRHTHAGTANADDRIDLDATHRPSPPDMGTKSRIARTACHRTTAQIVEIRARPGLVPEPAVVPDRKTMPPDRSSDVALLDKGEPDLGNPEIDLHAYAPAMAADAQGFRRQRCPADVAAAMTPCHPGRCPFTARHPAPASPREEHPATIVVGGPTKGFLGNPKPSAIAANPAATGIGTPAAVLHHDPGLENVTIVRRFEPIAVVIQGIVEETVVRHRLIVGFRNGLNLGFQRLLPSELLLAGGQLVLPGFEHLTLGFGIVLIGGHRHGDGFHGLHIGQGGFIDRLGILQRLPLRLQLPSLGFQRIACFLQCGNHRFGTGGRISLLGRALATSEQQRSGEDGKNRMFHRRNKVRFVRPGEGSLYSRTPSVATS